jgi:hypothetical protein
MSELLSIFDLLSCHTGQMKRLAGSLFVAAHLPLTFAWSAGVGGTNVPVPTVEVRGRVVCLSEEMQRRHGANVAEKHEHDYGFKADSGQCYSLVRTPKAEALFVDTNLHRKVLLVNGRVFPKTQLLEVTGNLHSISGGRTNELYYYCDICSIDTSFPGPCLCCRELVRLVEEPINGKPKKR